METLQKSLILTTIGLALCGAGLWLYAHTPGSIVIESEESKNKDLEPVYNEIKWIPGKTKDVWMMKQSHAGRNASPHQWERLAIVIDKTATPKTARYYQFAPGPLEWSEDLLKERVEYRVSCFICHNNGPRGIRPVSDSPLAGMSWNEKLKIGLWNLRIKTYGRILFDKTHDEEDASLNVHFRWHGDPHNDLLKVPVCQKCHNEDGFLSRGSLRRQQIGTIEHLVAKGHMPPTGFQMTVQEKKQLQDFIRGFN
ncbi:hypothetical protein [Bdellovibrio sp. HCB337]|uniref:hypothetical protein n=1 Tax=Bdellovibrio sp. HCB337 TaxID=3394358 RepID=UPI0039A6C649